MMAAPQCAPHIVLCRSPWVVNTCTEFDKFGAKSADAEIENLRTSAATLRVSAVDP